MLEPILLIRINIFLGFARRTAPDFDYKSGFACRKGQVRILTKMQKMMKISDFQFEPITLNLVTQGSSWLLPGSSET